MAKEITLERFGFVGTGKECYWGLIGVLWVKPLPIHQILPPNNVAPPSSETEPKPPNPTPVPPTPTPTPPSPPTPPTPTPPVPTPPTPGPVIPKIPGLDELVPEPGSQLVQDIDVGKCYRLQQYVKNHFYIEMGNNDASKNLWLTNDMNGKNVWKALKGLDGDDTHYSFES